MNLSQHIPVTATHGEREPPDESGGPVAGGIGDQILRNPDEVLRNAGVALIALLIGILIGVLFSPANDPRPTPESQRPVPHPRSLETTSRWTR